MPIDAILFWILAAVTSVSAVMVITHTNPIYSALSLAMTMVGVAAIFASLGAYFLAGVQLIVYAGAVMVLFVMVLMLFDLRNEVKAFARGMVSGTLKLATVGMFAGLVVGGIFMSAPKTSVVPLVKAETTDSTVALGQLLFSHYLFGFEALGALLLIVAVGTVALARSKGGTHAAR